MGRWAAGEEARAVVGPGGAGRARALLQKRTELLHGPGIEPGPPAWQARILPLNHPCTGGRCRPTLPQRGWPPTAGQRFLLARGLLLPLSRRRTPVACKRGSGPRGGPQGAALSGGLEAGTEGRRVGGSEGRRVGGAEGRRGGGPPGPFCAFSAVQGRRKSVGIARSSHEPKQAGARPNPSQGRRCAPAAAERLCSPQPPLPPTPTPPPAPDAESLRRPAFWLVWSGRAGIGARAVRGRRA